MHATAEIEQAAMEQSESESKLRSALSLGDNYARKLEVPCIHSTHTRTFARPLPHTHLKLVCVGMCVHAWTAE